MKKTFLFLADGFEEIEAVSVIDLLRRGGVDLKTVSILAEKRVMGSHGIVITADLILDDIISEEAECLIFPGGMPGSKHLGDCSVLMDMLQKQYDEGGYIAAICAAPALVLGQLKLKNKLRLTCYPSFETYFSSDFELSDEGVVVDGKVITAKGAGFALEFALTLLGELKSVEESDKVAEGILLKLKVD